MTPEGMVHALEETRRLLKPEGTLVDIHPTLEPTLIEVHKGGSLLSARPKADHAAEGYRQADNALAQAVQRQLFAVEHTEQFDFLIYGSSVAELREYIAESNAYNDSPEDEAESAREAGFFASVEEIMQGAAEGAEVATHERAIIARLRPIR
jgi:ubiquinone/menaquinone biosynthesis C-methylase UbiE